MSSIRARLEKKALLDELDAFAHTVAHDLKNPIAVVSMRAQLLRSLWDRADDAKLLQHVIELDKNTARLNTIVDELLLLAGVRRQTVQPQRVDMYGGGSKSPLGRVEHLGSNNPRRRWSSRPGWPVSDGARPLGGRGLDELSQQCHEIRRATPGHPAGSRAGAGARLRARFWVQDNGPGLDAGQQAQLCSSNSRA